MTIFTKKKSNIVHWNSLFSNGPAATDLICSEQSFGYKTRWDDPNYIRQLDELEQIKESNKLSIQTVSSIPIESTSWIYPDWLPARELTILAGAPGSGKTAFACSLAAGVTNGVGYQLHPGLKVNGRGHVIIINNEDSLENTLGPRLIAAGANLDFVHCIDTREGYETFRPHFASGFRKRESCDCPARSPNLLVGDRR